MVLFGSRVSALEPTFYRRLQIRDKMIIEFAKLFARNGFYVFPTYKSRSSNFAKPYGWTGAPVREEGKEHLAIPATTAELEIDTWHEQVKTKYNSEITGYGILGRGIIIFDIDTKNGKAGIDNFTAISQKFNLPRATLMAKSKSGGIHMFFAKPAKFKQSHVKSVAGVVISGVKYEGVDIRGDGGFVQGATSFGDWAPGKYSIIRGEPGDKLSEIPESLAQFLVTSNFGSDLDAMVSSSNITKSNDIASMLRRGELPDHIPNGARNESFFIFLTALKSKGIDRTIAKSLAEQLADRCEDKETLHESVNIEDMLDRIFEKSVDNPYDIGLDLVSRGLHLLMNHKSKPTYVILESNPYLLSKSPHDIAAMRELLAKYAKPMTMADGRQKIVNPIDVAIRRIPDNQKADTLGFKPGAPSVFTHNDDPSGTRYLNLYQPPMISVKPSDVDSSVYEEFKILISRIFGPEGSDEYQLGLDFSAWFIQYPELKCVIAPYILSRNRGVGKSLYLNLLTRILGYSKAGERQARIVKLTDLSKQFFNPTGVLLNIVDEVQFSVHRNMRQETADFWRSLKNLITADTWPVEIKHGGYFNMPNTAGLIMAGNTGSNFPMEEADRRIWVIDNSPPIMERGVVDQLYNIIKNTGIEKGAEERRRQVESIRWHLKEHSIKLALDSMHAPMNQLKLDMLKSTMTDVDEWLYDYFSCDLNLISRTPVITKSSFIYMMQVSDMVPVDRWRDEAEMIFREARRKGHIQAIKIEGGIVGQFSNVPIVTRNGDLIISDRKEQLFTTRDHGAFDAKPVDIVKKALFRNLQSITQWKKESVSRARKQVTIDEIQSEVL